MGEFPAPPPQPVEPRYTGPGPSGPRAGFWARLGALFIDGLIILIATVILVFILGFVFAGVEPSSGAGDAISIALALAYYGYLEGSNSGQTIGKRALGIRVIDFNTGGSIGFGRALIRYVGRILSTIPCLLGYFWMLWDKEKQCWHDKIATDVVVPVESYPVRNWPN